MLEVADPLELAKDDEDKDTEALSVAVEDAETEIDSIRLGDEETDIVLEAATEIDTF